VFSYHFDALISKTTFKNKKKSYFDAFSSKKQQQSHFHQTFYTCFFATHIFQSQFLPNTYLNPTNHTFLNHVLFNSKFMLNKRLN